MQLGGTVALVSFNMLCIYEILAKFTGLSSVMRLSAVITPLLSCTTLHACLRYRGLVGDDFCLYSLWVVPPALLAANAPF